MNIVWTGTPTFCIWFFSIPENKIDTRFNRPQRAPSLRPVESRFYKIRWQQCVDVEGCYFEKIMFVAAVIDDFAVIFLMWSMNGAKREGERASLSIHVGFVVVSSKYWYSLLSKFALTVQGRKLFYPCQQVALLAYLPLCRTASTDPKQLLLDVPSLDPAYHGL